MYLETLIKEQTEVVRRLSVALNKSGSQQDYHLVEDAGRTLQFYSEIGEEFGRGTPINRLYSALRDRLANMHIQLKDTDKTRHETPKDSLTRDLTYNISCIELGINTLVQGVRGEVLKAVEPLFPESYKNLSVNKYLAKKIAEALKTRPAL